MKVSVIIPCYNEISTIDQIIDKIILQKNINKQIILIDDCSTDGTTDIIKSKISNKVDKVIFHDKNLGKGASIKSGLAYVEGEIILIQDADLEYDPEDYENLIKPILNKETKVVYGSRVMGKKRFNAKFGIKKNFRVFANLVLTIFSNIINKQNLTDAHTCYKVFHKSVLENINLKENGFSFCPEITTKISNSGYQIVEVPVKYHGREYSEGKKIVFSDGIEAIFTLFKYKFKKG